jgi:hypothetical protein
MGVDGQCHTLATLSPGKRTRTHCTRSLSGPQGCSGWGAENLAPSKVWSRPVQPVASHYNDWAVAATKNEEVARCLWIIRRGLYLVMYFLGLSRNFLPLQNSESHFHGNLTLSWLRWLHFVPDTMLMLFIFVSIPIYALISQVVSRPSSSLIKVFSVFLICLRLILLHLTAIVTGHAQWQAEKAHGGSG